MASVGNFLKLDWREKFFVFWLAYKILCINRLLKTHGLKMTHRKLLDNPAKGLAIQQLSSRRLIYWVKLLTAFLIGSKDTCLRHSLVIWWLLHSRGKDAELCIGLNRKDVQLLGHAWVEVNGNVVNDTAENISQYKRMELEKYNEILSWTS